jgi:hypothetical protein
MRAVCLVSLSLVVFASSCVYDDLTPPEATFVCDSTRHMTFSEISPIITLKCGPKGCRNSSDNYVPNLGQARTFSNNRFDCKEQLESGAMPPSDHPQLSANERVKILCWISYGVE